MTDIIQQAILKGAKLYSNISGGKDGQAMTKILLDWNFKIEGLIHADLGRAEWKESLVHCRKLAELHNIPLNIVTRADGRDLLAHWQHRMNKLEGTGKPFWSSSTNRYCTSDMKRDPINRFYTSTGHDFIISCEGIRAQESVARGKKEPLTIRRNSSSYYDGMTVEQAIAAFTPGKKLFITWFPIFNFTLDEVWATFDNSQEQLDAFRTEYNITGVVNSAWNFCPVYVYGNERLSCSICILGSCNDISNGAKYNPEFFNELVKMEIESGFTFRKNLSLQTLK